jgi:hypothetical protein
MIVFKQLTISIKTQNDNKIKVYFHVARINKILHYMLNMTINTVGTLNLSTEFGALLVFSVFIATLDFFSQEMRPSFSMLNAKALRLFTFCTIFTSCIAT